MTYKMDQWTVTLRFRTTHEEAGTILEECMAGMIGTKWSLINETVGYGYGCDKEGSLPDGWRDECEIGAEIGADCGEPDCPCNLSVEDESAEIQRMLQEQYARWDKEEPGWRNMM